VKFFPGAFTGLGCPIIRYGLKWWPWYKGGNMTQILGWFILYGISITLFVLKRKGKIKVGWFLVLAPFIILSLVGAFFLFVFIVYASCGFG
jgi:hypothetical protein